MTKNELIELLLSNPEHHNYCMLMYVSDKIIKIMMED
jgi:hypothetical protein